MTKTVVVGSAILIALAVAALAQGNITQSASQGAHPLPVLGQTGTMYNGNNVNLQLPPEQNRYWANLWAGPMPAENIGPAGAAGGSGGGPSGAGVH